MGVTPSDPALRDSIAYTPAPKFQGGAKKRPGWNRLIVAATVAALVVGGGALMLNRQLNSPSVRATRVQVSSTVESQNIVFVSDRDLDVDATAKAKAALSRGEILPVLATTSEQVRREIASGEQSLYTVRILDFLDEDGDAVKIFVNDVPFGEVILSNSGAKLTIPLKKGATTKITCLASQDGGGGVTFRAISSVGEMRTRVMAVGESETWTVAFK
jgi:hypothetical protein